MDPFDADRWYQINMPIFDKKSMIGRLPQDPSTTADVFFKLTSISSNGRRWQIFPTDNGTYVLRTHLSSPNAYLAIQHDADTKGGTAIMQDVASASDGIFWNISRFPNGGYKLVNVASGTNWQLHAGSAESVALTNNITGEQDNQQFDFTSLESISNASFSSIKLPSGSYATLPAASSQESSGGVRQGQKIAIGVSVGVGALILAAVVFGVYSLLRRRRRRREVNASHSSDLDKPELDSTPLNHRVEMGLSEHALGGEYKPYTHELQSAVPLQELDSTERARILRR